MLSHAASSIPEMARFDRGVHARRHRDIGTASQSRGDDGMAVIRGVEAAEHWRFGMDPSQGRQGIGNETFGATRRVRGPFAQALGQDHRGQYRRWRRWPAPR